jgi:hypothetical protein
MKQYYKLITRRKALKMFGRSVIASTLSMNRVKAMENNVGKNWNISTEKSSDIFDYISVSPRDTGEALINPGMGWAFHYYSGRTGNYGYYLDPSDSLDWFPGCSVVYMRIPWTFIEPEEGVYNWTVFDTPAQRFISRGKKISMRINCCEHWIPWATPKWLMEKGAKGVWFIKGKGPDPKGQLWEPDYLDPIYLEKLEALVKALSDRYDNNPNVAFIDIGTFGLWGEGHTGSRLSSR